MGSFSTQVLATIVSNLAYQHRFGSFFTEPLVAGLDPITNKVYCSQRRVTVESSSSFQPYICGMDTIGCIASPEDFVAVGTGQEYLLGVCESE